MTVIGELGPQLSAAGTDPAATRERVVATIRHHLQAESRDLTRGPRADHERADGRHPRLRAVGAAPRRRLDHGDHGQRAGRDLDRASGPPLRDDRALQGRLTSAADHQQDRGADRSPHRRGLADGRRAPARRLTRQRDHPAAVALGPADHDSQVLEEAAHARRHGQPRDDVAGVGRVPADVRQRRAQHHGQRRHRLRQDDVAERALVGDPGRATGSSRSRTRPSSSCTSGTCCGSSRGPPNIEGEGAIPIRELVRNSLRMRPDRIIVGEIRGAEALDMLQAMNTGHDGSLSTVHANSPRDALTASRRWC